MIDYQAPKIPEDPRLRDLQRAAASLLQVISLGILEADRPQAAEALVYLQAAASALVADEFGPNPLLDPARLLERLTASSRELSLECTGLAELRHFTTEEIARLYQIPVDLMGPTNAASARALEEHLIEDKLRGPGEAPPRGICRTLELEAVAAEGELGEGSSIPVRSDGPEALTAEALDSGVIFQAEGIHGLAAIAKALDEGKTTLPPGPNPSREDLTEADPTEGNKG